MHIARTEQTHVAVTAVVAPRRTGAEATSGDSRLVGHIFELAVAQIVVERVASVARDVDILEPIVVIVGNGNTHSPALAREAGRFGDVGELQVTILEAGILMEERNHRIATLPKALDGRSIDGDDVEFAVGVAIDQTDTAAHRFDNVLLVSGRNV